mgnify:CR=1 FL=1
MWIRLQALLLAKKPVDQVVCDCVPGQMRLWASYGGDIGNGKETFVVNGMTCASCVVNVENAVNKLDGVDKAVVNLTTEKMSVDYAWDKSVQKLLKKLWLTLVMRPSLQPRYS